MFDVLVLFIILTAMWGLWTYWSIKFRLFKDTSTSGDSGYIYAVRGKNDPWWSVKIGRSNDVFRRMRGFRTISDGGIHIVAVRAVGNAVDSEKRIHDRFAGLRKKGEWFRMSLYLRLYLIVFDNTILHENLQSYIDDY